MLVVPSLNPLRLCEKQTLCFEPLSMQNIKPQLCTQVNAEIREIWETVFLISSRNVTQYNFLFPNALVDSWPLEDNGSRFAPDFRSSNWERQEKKACSIIIIPVVFYKNVRILIHQIVRI